MVQMRASLATLILVSLSACSVPGPGEAPDGVHDPHEQTNRKVHAFNRKIDQKVLRSAGVGYATVVPEGVQDNVSNFADTVALPGTVVNQILQGRPGPATRNTVRFAINATLGFAGLADVATDFGIPEDNSDFGETLAVWGVPEGAYMELPFLGPSTERDTAGIVVDFFTNPLDYVIPSEYSSLGTSAYVLSKVGDRGRFADTVDSIYYESADSYAQLRLIYLQNRRYELGEEAPADEIDPLALDTEGF
ncbi:putative phospholipid-binding lipoprotein MlaA precursor [Pelagimonas phthalicica]|uniref:Putative phospholipid-binding lipoprotein MlaA n=1 Tax=Pelagimonas phthalicica TaxID=1037362 RepID=A0A238J7R8_9RHOB|nr:VacJ family lipoprotein [Pelagimonas phthalicica]TDS94691.1 phospholipid-binding lipoprotein MlaA [Pelagimonas phthalicica]SMX26781.1 putative phospholipid-binding lipoprotein MlaA precursor [Pelagimonas phthalicica]